MQIRSQCSCIPPPVNFVNPVLFAPLQKPGLFFKAAESVGSHPEPVGGSPPGHRWPWLPSQRPRGDWQDPLQKLPQGPGRAGVRLQSRTSGRRLCNGHANNKSDDGGLCSGIYGLREKREREKLTNWGIYIICEWQHSRWWTTHCGRTPEGQEVVSRRREHSMCWPNSKQMEVRQYQLWIYPLSYKNLTKNGL